MSTQAQYAVTPKVGIAALSVANTNRDGTGTVPQVIGGGASGSRIDKLIVEATASTTAGMVRLFLTEGAPGAPIASITFAGTTATVTTTIAHGRTTGNLATVRDAFPFDYNIKDTALTVTGATTFTYVMATVPTANASTLGTYFTTPAVPVTKLMHEVPISLTTPSATAQTFQSVLTPTVSPSLLPIFLPPGYSLRASTHNAETFNVIAPTGDF